MHLEHLLQKLEKAVLDYCANEGDGNIASVPFNGGNIETWVENGEIVVSVYHENHLTDSVVLDEYLSDELNKRIDVDYYIRLAKDAHDREWTDELAMRHELCLSQGLSY